MTATGPDVDVPVLGDGAVILRAHTFGDVDDMLGMGGDPETRRWTTVPVPFERRHAVEWVTEIVPAGWRDQTSYGWAIEAAAPDGSRRFAGNVDVRLGPPPDIGYALAPWARGRGVMARAVRLATRWCFDVGGLPVVHWSAHAGNIDSWRVAHATGFTFHGSRPLSQPQRGDLHDGWYASLRPDDEAVPRTTWWPVPVLEGQGVRLRPFTDADLPRIVQTCSDRRTRHWLPTLPAPYTLDDARAFVTDSRLQESLGQKVTWAVADRDSDQLLGDVAVFRLGDPMCPGGSEIGYWAHPDARGRGVMGEALDLVLRHALRPRDAGGLGRHRVQLGASWGNAASRRVAERAGFTQVGHFRLDGVVGVEGDADRELQDGAWYDLLGTDPR